MQAGSLDRQITLKHLESTTDTSGGVNQTYVTYATVWADKIDLRGTQFIAAQQTNSQITTKFRIRYRADVLATDRIGFKGREYDIIGVPVEIGRNEGYEIMAKARDSL